MDYRSNSKTLSCDYGATLHRFLKIGRKSGEFKISKAPHFLDFMVSLGSPPRISSFNLIFDDLVKSWDLSCALSCDKLMADLAVGGLSPSSTY